MTKKLVYIYIDEISNIEINKFLGIFLENDFLTPPPPINFVHGSYRLCYDMNKIDHVAAALGPESVFGLS